jgi:hypothetical protein
MTTPLNRFPLAAAILLMLLSIAACGQESGPDGEARDTGGATAASHAPNTPTATSPAQAETQTSDATEDTGPSMDIQLTIGDTALRGRLDDTSAGRDFASLLPLTLTLTDFHATEKISDLPKRLSTEDEVPAGTSGSAGDITVYAPWGNLALFYRDFTYTDDLIRLGSLEPGAAEVLADLADGTTVTITTAN